MSSRSKILTSPLKTTNRRRKTAPSPSPSPSPATTAMITRKLRRKPNRHFRRTAHRKTFNNGGRCNNNEFSKVSDKLQTLKNLIPAQNINEEVKSENLFEKTAEYIVLLRTQVVILQRLIQFYGSSDQKEHDLL